MLDCSGNNAFKVLENNTKDFLLSVDILYDTFEKSRDEAAEVYARYVDPYNASLLTDMTHCTNPPESIFITSEDMVGKSGVWSHFGSWNFTRAALIDIGNRRSQQEFLDFTKEKMNLSPDDALKLLGEVKSIGTGGSANTWIAPWPSYAGGPAGCREVQPKLLECANGPVINLSDMNTTLHVNGGVLVPNSIAYVDGGEVKEKLLNPGAELSVTLIPEGENGYKTLVLHAAHARSVFTRLFFMEGHGLKHFKKLTDVTGVTGQRIIIWKVDWEGNSTIEVDSWMKRFNESSQSVENAEAVANESE